MKNYFWEMYNKATIKYDALQVYFFILNVFFYPYESNITLTKNTSILLYCGFFTNKEVRFYLIGKKHYNSLIYILN